MIDACYIARIVEAELKSSGFEGKLTLNAPLAPLTSYMIGGPAALLAEATSLNDLIIMKKISSQHSLPLLVLGAGTNILFADDGYQGAVVKLGGEFSNFNISDLHVTAGAAVPLQKLVTQAAQAGCNGIQRLAGIPGSVGGAIAMNAGSFGEYIGDVVAKVTILSTEGEPRNLTSSECEFSYRTSRFLRTNEIILEAHLKFSRADSEAILEEVMRRIKHRTETQPSLPSCGCVFKNPSGNLPAAKLIQDAGLKGTRRGGASISEIHANFIVNEGGARAIDILELMALARLKVREKFGVNLMPEVRAYGFPVSLEGMLDAIEANLH